MSLQGECIFVTLYDDGPVACLIEHGKVIRIRLLWRTKLSQRSGDFAWLVGDVESRVWLPLSRHWFRCFCLPRWKSARGIRLTRFGKLVGVFTG